MSADPPALARRILLVGWDGADWKFIDPLLERGQMPHLQRLIDRGVMGNIASLDPMLSPILWTTIATGKHADKHGILGFVEPDPATGRIRPVSSTSRRCRAIWNILSEQGRRAGVVNWYASHPAEPIHGAVVTDRFGHAVAPPHDPWPPVPGSVHPEEYLDGLCALRVHPAATTPRQVAPFIADPAGIDPATDQHLQQLRVLLAECATTHAAATWLLQVREWDFFAVYYDAIDRFSHSFMEFHPPKTDHVSQEEFDRYKDVVTGCYRFHDMMLGRLMELAGEDTTIILLSDHGFHSDHQRPAGSSRIRDGRPVAWHRRYGILVIAGPHLKQDERVYGASLLDITPTVLWLLGCPVARDMDGKALTQIAAETEEARAPVTFIQTYENDADALCQCSAADPRCQGSASSVQSNPSPSSESRPPDDVASRQAVDRLAALGYLEPEPSVEGVLLDRSRNLGLVYAATGRPALAVAQFEEVLANKPEDNGTRIALATCCLGLGRVDRAADLVQEVLTSREDAPRARLLSGMICFHRGENEAALEHLRAAEATGLKTAELYCHVGNVHLRQRRWPDAERTFRSALELDLDCAEAYDGLGVAQRAQGRPAEAVHQHMQSIALLHHRPRTHVNLGLALAQVGRLPWARRAFEVALEMDPRNVQAHRCLAELYEHAFRNPARAAEHRRQAEQHAGRITPPQDDTDSHLAKM